MNSLFLNIKLSLIALKAHWRSDMRAGFDISLIAMPLSLGIALASGFPPMAGLITAILGGLLVSRINGSNVTITGPAAGLIVVNLMAIEMLGLGDSAAGYRFALAAIVIAGLIVFIFGVLKLGKFGDFFPLSAVHGMLAAIGVIIMVKQFYVATGVRAHGHELYEIIEEIPLAILHSNPEVVLIAVVSLFILIFQPRISWKWIKALPSPLWVLIVAIPLEFLMDWEHEHEVLFLGEHHKVGPQLLVHLPNDFMSVFTIPDFSKIYTGAFWIVAITIALVTAIESLLSTLAIDGLDPMKRRSNLNKDVAAVGFGSSLAGFIGGLPMISEIVRSSANITSGAKTQWSNFFHGVFLLIFIFVLRPLIEHIPLSALAAMLIYTGFRLASPREFRHAWELGRSEFAVFCTTLVMVLLTDLIMGIAAGIVLHLILLLFKGVDVKNLFMFKCMVDIQSDRVIVKPVGAISFANYLGMKKIMVQNSKLPITFDMAQVHLIDHTALSHLYHFEMRQQNVGLSVTHINDGHLHTIGSHHLAEQRENTARIRFMTSRRNAKIKEFAIKLRGTFQGRSSECFLFNGVNVFLEQEVSEVKNCIHFETGSIPAVLADISLRTESKFAHHDKLLTALFLKLEGIPEFRLQKEFFLDKMMEKVGRQDIDFEDYPDFSSHYLLQGFKEDDIRSFFSPKIIEYFDLYRGFNVFGNRDGIVITRGDKQISISEMQQMIQFGEGLILRIVEKRA